MVKDGQTEKIFQTAADPIPLVCGASHLRKGEYRVKTEGFRARLNNVLFVIACELPGGISTFAFERVHVGFRTFVFVLGWPSSSYQTNTGPGSKNSNLKDMAS